MIRVLVADDHPVIHEGLKKMFKKVHGIRVTGEASTGEEVLNEIERNDYDLVLLDISMPDKSGLEVLKELKRKRPDLQVLILSIHGEEQYAIRALKAGAAGYLTKKSVQDELIKAVQKISQGGKYITSSLAEKMASYLDKMCRKLPHEILSEREFQVMCLIAKGKTRKEIAEELSISVDTISTYRARILEKMKMKRTVELTNYANKIHLID
jgi:two-component system invasion response regulator UvrY